MAEIRVENLRKVFAEFVAVEDSTFTVADGEFFVMLGPSGCGKTTTLRMIAGLELPTSGRILLDGEDVTFKRAGERDIAFVFQLFALYPHMNVRKNIAFPLISQGMPRAEIKRRVEETAKLLRIDHILDRPVSGLAGGDRQRVALGRAIVRRPKVFLMDEPLGTLDAEFRDLMVRELRELHNRIGATTVYVTHDQLEAMAMADKIAVMNRGVIEQFAPPQEIYDRPASMFVADFIGSPPMNFLSVRSGLQRGAKSIRVNGATVAVPEFREDAAGVRARLGVRPEHIRLDDSSAFRGSVFGAEYLGTTQIVTVTTSHGPLKARLPANVAVRPGETVGLAFRGERLSVFDKASGRAIRTALHATTGAAAAWLRSASPASASASADRSRSTGSTSSSPTASSSSSSGRPAPARRRRCASSPASSGRTRDRSRIGGRDVTFVEPPARDVAFVFQQYSLYPHLSVFDNLAFPLRSPARRMPEDEIRKRVGEVAEMLRIAAKLKNRATQLSGGEMQRVAIGRALVRAPVRLPDGRAALLARRQAPRRPPPGAEAHPAGPRRDHPLRHARPDRGHDHGQPHRHPARRPPRPDRHAARDLRRPAERLCRRASRPAGDQPVPGRAHPGRSDAPVGTSVVGARTEHFRIDRARNGSSAGTRRLGRASRRPEPSPCRARRPQARHPRRSGERPEGRRRASRIELVDPLYFDAEGRRLGGAR